MGTQPDYSRAALARFIEFVVAKGLVHPATAQGWRVATAKVLEDLSPAEEEDVRRIDVEATFKGLSQPVSRPALAGLRGRVSPAGPPGHRGVRQVDGRSGQLCVPIAGAIRPRRRRAGGSTRRRGTADGAAMAGPARPRSGGARQPRTAWRSTIRCARTCWPRSSFRATSRSRKRERMGAFLLTLAVDFRPAPARER